jgi:hypothetical protein
MRELYRAPRAGRRQRVDEDTGYGMQGAVKYKCEWGLAHSVTCVLFPPPLLLRHQFFDQLRQELWVVFLAQVFDPILWQAKLG